MSRYRQGSKVAINVYDGDRPLFQAHSVEDAEESVRLLNLGVEFDALGPPVILEASPYGGGRRLAAKFTPIDPETPPDPPVAPSDTPEAQREPETAGGTVPGLYPPGPTSDDSGRCLVSHDGLRCRFLAGHEGGCHGGQGLTMWATLDQACPDPGCDRQRGHSGPHRAWT